MTSCQAKGTLRRALVDGARHICLWGKTVGVAAAVHTVGGGCLHIMVCRDSKIHYVLMETDIGGERILEELEDDPLPRIC